MSIELIDLQPAVADLVQLVRKGMRARPRQLPAWLLYDAEGSRLFAQICDQPEYTLTRTEIQLLRSASEAIAAAVGSGVIVEFGIGNTRKVDPLLRAIRPRLPEEGDKLLEALCAGSAEPGAAAYVGAYTSFVGSPLHAGQFQFDLWDSDGGDTRYDWESLRADVRRWGARNSLLLAPMPTASTAQILGNNECFEPYTSNLYARRTLAGEFFVLNPHLQRELQVRQLAH